MQENVKVFTPEVLVEIFGDVKVKGDFSYKIRLDHINSRELAELANVNSMYGMDFHIKRSGKGLVIYVPTIDSLNEKAIFKRSKVRDFYENLPQEARMKAFDNTSRNKWNMEVNSLEEAVLRSFYISNSPEGAEYWQDVILNNSILQN